MGSIWSTEQGAGERKQARKWPKGESHSTQGLTFITHMYCAFKVSSAGHHEICKCSVSFLFLCSSNGEQKHGQMSVVQRDDDDIC